MAEKCEFVLEPKAVEFTELIQSMTGKHQLWELSENSASSHDVGA